MRLAAFLAATLACVGCSGADASKEIETLQSWRATIDLTTDAQVKGWVTPRYARQLRDEGRRAVAQGDALALRDKSTPADRDSLTAAGAELRAALARLDRAGR